MKLCTIDCNQTPMMAGDIEPDRLKPMDLFSSGKPVKICAPMVRYSKLPFRMLVRKYKCDLTYTPMIIADSFVKSLKARDSDFTTCPEDRPLIVQFAANNATVFADSAEIVAPFADGIDLNCGCPQRWAMTEGYGACLLSKPDLVSDMVRQARERVGNPDFTVSIKIRIHGDIRKTVELCRRAEKCGVSWISVHGRTKDQRCQPVNLEAVRTVKDGLSIPVVANGDIKHMADVTMVTEATRVDGVMSARGMLANPALYAGYDYTPVQCIYDWLDISTSLGTPFQCFHHHLIYMMDKLLSRAERQVFNSLASTSAVIEFIKGNFPV